MKIYYLSAWAEINYYSSYSYRVGELGTTRRGSIAAMIGD